MTYTRFHKSFFVLGTSLLCFNTGCQLNFGTPNLTQAVSNQSIQKGTGQTLSSASETFKQGVSLKSDNASTLPQTVKIRHPVKTIRVCTGQHSIVLTGARHT